MSDLHILLLGTPIITYQSTPIEVDTRKAVALLSYLAIENTTISRDTLTTLLWPDYDEEHGRASLRRTLSVAHSALGRKWLCIDPRQISLIQAPGLFVDVLQFRNLIDAAHIPNGEDSFRNVQPLMDAINLYRGRFLAGFSLKDSAEFDNWQALISERLDQELHQAFDDLTTQLIQLQEFTTATNYLKHWLQLDPLSEPACFRLMQIYGQLGQRAAAIRQYKEYEILLNEELGIAPLQETIALYETILKDDFRPVSLHIPQAEKLPADVVHYLPVYTKPFIGRQTEIQTITEKLADPLCRLLTIVGPSGVGKTRLAVEIARTQSDKFKHGAYILQLEVSVSEDALVTKLMDILEVTLHQNSSPKRQIIECLKNKNMLLIFDNFESYMDRKPLISEILEAAPHVKMLVTSQERLNVHEEWLIGLHGLELCGAPFTHNCEAIRLFIECALCIAPDFSLAGQEQGIVQICRLLDGIPLAIELAAQWVELLSCQEIAAEIQNNYDMLQNSIVNIPDRHLSLRAAFEYSWNLLSGDLQKALQRLSIFEEGFTYQASSTIAKIPLDTLAKLVHRSILWNIGQERHSIPHAFKPYIQEKSVNPEEIEQIRKQHCQYYSMLFKVEDLNGPQQEEVLQQIKNEQRNILAGWQWAVKNRHLECLDRYCDLLYIFFDIRSQFNDGRILFANALSTLEWNGKTPLAVLRLCSKLKSRLGLFYIRLAEYDQAHELLQTSLALQEHTEDDTEVAFTCNALGVLYLTKGQYSDSQRYFDRSLKIYEELCDRFSTAKVLNNLGIIAGHCSNYAEATDILLRSLQIFRSDGNRREISSVLTNLGNVALSMQDMVSAQQFFEESYQIKASLKDRWGAACCLINLGQIAKIQCNYTEAEQIFLRSLDISSELGKQSGIINALGALGILAFEQQNYPDASQYLVTALKMALEVEAFVMALDVLKDIAKVLLERGYTTEASQILNAVILDPRVHRQTKKEAEQLTQHITLPSRTIPHPAALEQIKEKVFKMDYVPLTILLRDVVYTSVPKT